MYTPSFVALPIQPGMQGMQPVLLPYGQDGNQDDFWQAGWTQHQWMPIMMPADAGQASGTFTQCAEVLGPMVAGVQNHNQADGQDELTTPTADGEVARRGRPRRRGRRSRRSGQGAASPMEGSPQTPADVGAKQRDGVFQMPAPAVMPVGIVPATARPAGPVTDKVAPFADASMQGPMEPTPQVGVWLKLLSSVTEEHDDEAEAKLQPSSQREYSGSSTASTQALDSEYGSLEELAENQDQCNEVVARLDAAGCIETRQIIEWLLPAAMSLSLSRFGCRVVQKALEATGGAGRDLLVAELEPHTVELYESLHGNHVLTKMIEMLPSAALRPIIGRLWEKGATTAARHRFGCRVFERLIEHCSESEIGPLMDQIVAESEALCRHQFGNFVVQHLLEHGSPHRRTAILQRLLPNISTLAMHRTASHVVQRALDYSDEEGQAAIVSALLWAPAPGSLVEVASSRYGSFVAEQLTTLKLRNKPGLSDEILRRLTEGVSELGKTHCGKRVAECFGLEVPELAEENMQ